MLTVFLEASVGVQHVVAVKPCPDSTYIVMVLRIHVAAQKFHGFPGEIIVPPFNIAFAVGCSAYAGRHRVVA